MLNPQLAGYGAVFASIVESQKAIVKSYENSYGSRKFTVDSTVEVVNLGSKGDQGAYFFGGALLAYARANGLRLSWLEVEEAIGPPDLIRNTLAKPPTEPLKSVLNGSDRESLNAAAAKWVSELMPDLEMNEKEALDYLNYNEKFELQEAIKRAMTPPQVPVAEALKAMNSDVDAAVASLAAGASAVAGVDGIGDDDWVGISGNTMKWKGDIKLLAATMGDGAAWDGDQVQWNVQFKVFKALAQRSPESMVAGQLKMVEFSGKYPKGFMPKR